MLKVLQNCPILKNIKISVPFQVKIQESKTILDFVISTVEIIIQRKHFKIFKVVF